MLSSHTHTQRYNHIHSIDIITTYLANQQSPNMFSRSLRSTNLARLPKTLTPLTTPLRTFTATQPTRVEEITREAIDTPLSLWNFTEEENMLRETGMSCQSRCERIGRERDHLLMLAVRRFAEDVVGPRVREMDESETMDPVGDTGNTGIPRIAEYIRLLSKACLTME
jgi:hypothetical protein